MQTKIMQKVIIFILLVFFVSYSDSYSQTGNFSKDNTREVMDIYKRCNGEEDCVQKNLEDYFTALEKRVRRNVDKLKQQVQYLTVRLREADAKIDKLQKLLDNSNRSIDSLVSHIDDIKKTYEEKMLNLNNELLSLKADAVKNIEDKEILQARISTLEFELESHQKKLLEAQNIMGNYIVRNVTFKATILSSPNGRNGSYRVSLTPSFFPNESADGTQVTKSMRQIFSFSDFSDVKIVLLSYKGNYVNRGEVQIYSDNVSIGFELSVDRTSRHNKDGNLVVFLRFTKNDGGVVNKDYSCKDISF